MDELRAWRDQETDCWWFTNPDPDGPAMGPYRTKAEMLDDKRGIERTMRTKTWQQIMRGDPDGT
jgi:hypothetical protein